MREITDFIKVKNSNDKNSFLSDEKDNLMMQQLPKSCQIAIYTQFIFREFLHQFRLFFNFTVVSCNPYNIVSKKNQTLDTRFSNYIKYARMRLPDGKVTLSGREFPYPYYTFQDDTYSGFMIDLLDSLEFRMYQPGTLIANELGECNEVLFVQQGMYNVGYQINNKVYYRKQLGKQSTIGGFQIMFNKRFQFIYKTCNIVKGLSVRKESFIQIASSWPEFMPQMRTKFWKFYAQNIYWTLIQRKEIDIMDYKYRSDFN